jgi:hypothetical protein
MNLSYMGYIVKLHSVSRVASSREKAQSRLLMLINNVSASYLSSILECSCQLAYPIPPVHWQLQHILNILLQVGQKDNFTCIASHP